jgi:hypothetical protein
MPTTGFSAIMTLNPVPVSLVSGEEWCQAVSIYYRGEHNEPVSYFAKYDPNTREFTVQEYGWKRVQWVGRSAEERRVEPMFPGGGVEGLCYDI